MTKDRIHELSEALKISERRRQETQRLSGVGFWELNHKTGSLYWSEEIYDIYELDSNAQQPNYELFLSLIYDEDRTLVHQTYQDSVQFKTEYRLRYRVKAATSVKWIEAVGVTLYDAQGLPDRSIGTAHDITEIIAAQQQIERLAYHDALTDLPNRQLFADRLEQALSLGQYSKKLLAICYLDLDGFKPINDRFGHSIGDRLLIEFSERLQRFLRKEDTVARIGGDEFVVLLNGLDNIIQCEEILDRLLKKISQPFEIEALRLYVSASIGVTLYPQDESDPDTLLRHADQAMYRAKESGRNTFSLFNPIQDIKVQAFRKAIAEFDQALQQSQLVLHYQPRIDLRTGALVGVEALVRWQHPEKGLLYPGEFLPTIENTPLEIALDEWVLKTAFDQHMQWRNQGLKTSVSVNLSPRHIEQGSFPQYLNQLLTSYPKDMPQYLEFEILETSAIGDTAHVAEIMNDCVKRGVQFSLDDFGTGYSSLTYFNRLPINILKIDQNFVRQMLVDTQAQYIVEGVLKLAEALNRPVVAEGVENIELGLMLAQLGCQYAQGYGIAKPMPETSVLAWASGWRSEDLWHGLYAEVQDQEIHYDLYVAIYSHRRWMQVLEAYLKSNLTSASPALELSACQFSLWYDGIGASRYGKRPTYSLIRAQHDQAQQLAKEIVDLARTGAGPQAIDRMEELTSVGNQLIKMLTDLSIE
ncbi:MAG: EAL domain-containing protein [Leptolyngbyaceae cyanobacterium]